MKKTTLIIATVLCLALSNCGQRNKETSKFPAPKGYVNDFENLLSDQQELYLDSLVNNYEKRTKIEIAIVTLDSTMTTKESFDDFTLELANHWGIGKKELDNGVLFSVSSSIRKIRIQTGIGLTDQLTDAEAKSIIDNAIIPRFRNGDFFEGIKIGTVEIIRELD